MGRYSDAVRLVIGGCLRQATEAAEIGCLWLRASADSVRLGCASPMRQSNCIVQCSTCLNDCSSDKQRQVSRGSLLEEAWARTSLYCRACSAVTASPGPPRRAAQMRP